MHAQCGVTVFVLFVMGKINLNNLRWQAAIDLFAFPFLQPAPEHPGTGAARAGQVVMP